MKNAEQFIQQMNYPANTQVRSIYGGDTRRAWALSVKDIAFKSAEKNIFKGL